MLGIWHSLVNWTTQFLISQIYSLVGQLDKYTIQCDKCSDMGSTSVHVLFLLQVPSVTSGICFFSLKCLAS